MSSVYMMSTHRHIHQPYAGMITERLALSVIIRQMYPLHPCNLALAFDAHGLSRAVQLAYLCAYLDINGEPRPHPS